MLGKGYSPKKDLCDGMERRSALELESKDALSDNAVGKAESGEVRQEEWCRACWWWWRAEWHFFAEMRDCCSPVC